MKCIVCKKSKVLILHHLSYRPCKTIYVCRSCHQKIHLTNKYPEFKNKDPTVKDLPFPKFNKKNREEIIRQYLDKLICALPDARIGMPAHLIREKIKLLQWVVE